MLSRLLKEVMTTAPSEAEGLHVTKVWRTLAKYEKTGVLTLAQPQSHIFLEL